jgi:transglutaminase-like putative cysteine protease
VGVRSAVDVHPTPELQAADDVDWREIAARFEFGSGKPFDPACEFTFESPLIVREAAIGTYAAASFVEGAGILEASSDLMHRIHGDFRYLAGSTSVNTELHQAFDARTGVCQDFAHIMICGLRSLGLAARYVSGYLHTGHHGSGSRPWIGADASHAWVSVYCPPHGWVEFDPTNDVMVSDGHIRLGYGRDYSDVAPLKGVIVGGGAHELTVGVKVSERLAPTPGT